jgi:hypothetical protein
MKVQVRRMRDRGFESAPPAGSLFTCFLILGGGDVVCAVLDRDIEYGDDHDPCGQLQGPSRVRGGGQSVTIVIRDNTTIGFVTMCIEAVDR